MKLKPEILQVLGNLGVEQNEIDALIEHFVARLSEAQKKDETTLKTLGLLQARVDEANGALAATKRLREGIAKFVDAD